MHVGHLILKIEHRTAR